MARAETRDEMGDIHRTISLMISKKVAKVDGTARSSGYKAQAHSEDVAGTWG
jgi:hypothetical protein